REVDRACGESAVGPAGGLYTLRGLERRARELTSDAVRRRVALACVALGIGLDSKGDGAAVLPAAAAYAGLVLQVSGRTSDCVGRLGQGEFAVLAPGTAPQGAATMAQRLSRVLETAGPPPGGTPPLRVHRGYDAGARLPRQP